MNTSWLLLPSGLLALTAAAWYGYSSYSATPPPPATRHLPLQQRRSAPCMCGLPPSLRMRTILNHVFPERHRIQHRMSDVEEAPDLSQYSVEELQELLGLPEDLIPTEGEIEELQKLLDENKIPLSILTEAGDLNEEVNPAEEPEEEVEVESEVSSEEEQSPEEEEEEKEKEEGEKKKDKKKKKKKDKDKVSGNPFDIPFSPEVMDAADAVFEGSDIPVQTLSNPFPQNPFPADYDDYGSLYLGDGGYPLPSNSYLHPVRTFKFRLFMPTFHQFFGFQFASQTIVELYVAKIPGPKQITGIPDAFYEKKYWNVLFEVDGNQVISTIPQPGAASADEPVAEDAESRVDNGDNHHRNTGQHMSHRSSAHAFNDVHRRNFTYPARNSMYSSSGTPVSHGGSWGQAPPNLPHSMKNGGAFHSHQPPHIQGDSVIARRRGQPAAPVRSTRRRVKPAAVMHRGEMRERLRLRRRQRLQHEAKHGYRQRMTPARAVAWEHQMKRHKA